MVEIVAVAQLVVKDSKGAACAPNVGSKGLEEVGPHGNASAEEAVKMMKALLLMISSAPSLRE